MIYACISHILLDFSDYMRETGSFCFGNMANPCIISLVFHAEMRILGLSTITNVNDPDAPVPGDIDEIIAVANQTAPKIEALIINIAENID